MKHLCDQLLLHLGEDRYINVYLSFNTEAESWFLIYENYADQQEVRTGEADSEGELLISIEMAVQFCPFCGVHLK